MEEARVLIAALREINGTTDRSVAHFTPALIGMFGSARMFDLFLTNLDEALTSGSISQPLRERAMNLSRTFIPQVAGLNGCKDISARRVSVEELRAVSSRNRTEGVLAILAALMTILEQVRNIG